MRSLLFFILVLSGLPFIYSCNNNNWEEFILYAIYDNNDSIKDTINPIIDSTKTSTFPIKDSTNNGNDNSRPYLEVEKYMEQEAPYRSFFQGASCYGDFLFQLYSNNTYIFIYNLKEKKYLGEIKLAGNSKNHCNNASFSNIFYEEGDEFPLLYVSGGSSYDYNHVQVYRIQKKGLDFFITQIQEIILPEGNDKNGLYRTGVAIDNDSNYMYVYANHTDSARIVKLLIPDMHNKEIVLNEADILDYFPVEKFTHQQGAVIKNGFLYLISGVPAKGDINCLKIFDLKAKKQYKLFTLENTLLKHYEPEGLSFWNDTLVTTTNYGYGIFTIKLYK